MGLNMQRKGAALGETQAHNNNNNWRGTLLAPVFGFVSNVGLSPRLGIDTETSGEDNTWVPRSL